MNSLTYTLTFLSIFQMSGATGRDSGFINFRSLGSSQVVIWKSEKTFMKIIKKCKVDLTKQLLIRLKKVNKIPYLEKTCLSYLRRNLNYYCYKENLKKANSNFYTSTPTCVAR